MSLIDISPVVSPRTAVWPGDVAFSRSVALDMRAGANLTLSSVTTTVHVGAHADAPSHYARDGGTIETRPLELYYGECEVVRVDVARGARVEPAQLAHATLQAPRLLIATGTFADPDRFDTDFASLSPALVDYVAARGVRLIGLDTPSVDPFDDKALLAHNAIARHDMAILEGLVLSGVTPGLYTLVALPLRLAGADASPVRAALAPKEFAGNR